MAMQTPDKRRNGRVGDPPLRYLSLIMIVLFPANLNTARAEVPSIADVCKERKPCTLVKATPAGKDAQGHALTVVELNLGKKNPDNDSADERFNCRPYAREIWLRAAGAGEPKRILALCNDGYGAASVGEDDIKVRVNRLIHVQQGGSAWRWSNGRTIELSPLRVLSEESCNYHNINIGYAVTRWDWRRFAGERRWFPQACKEDDAREKTRPNWCDVARATRRHAVIPRLDGAMPAGEPVHLGSCASAFDESGQRGFVIFGKPRAAGAELRVLMVSNREIVISVSDRSFTAGAANWINDDHVELWIGQDQSGLSCNEPRIKLSQWAIGLDGKVQHAAGATAGAPELVGRAARAVAGRQQVTLRLRLPEVEDYLRALTVVFSKSEGGKQVRLTATSPVKRGDETTLSSVYPINARAARCAVRDGQLDILESGRAELLAE